jgi:beta-glucosidase
MVRRYGGRIIPAYLNRRKTMKIAVYDLLWFFAALFLISGIFAQKVPQLGKDPVKDVIEAMTLEEKTGLVVGTGMNFPGMPSESQGPVVGESSSKKVPGAAGTTRPISRLNIPAIILADGPAGLRIQPIRGDSARTYYCTAFPIATMLASTWNPDLVQQVGEAMGEEVREYGVDIILGPALNIHRNPLGGRNFEYFSEDPIVTGKMAAALVHGIQNQGVGTSIKHFVANNHEWNRHTINVIASERALREIYLRGFEIAVRESQPWTVMTSYNKVNGTYTSESADLVTKILRQDWGFKGFVMSDWFAGKDPVAQMQAGNDLLMPGRAEQQTAITDAVKNQLLNEKKLDENIEHILNIVLKSPAFKQIPFSDQPDVKAHAQVCREAAVEGMVLLKNESGLPLDAQNPLAVFGNSAFEMITGGTGSGDVNEAYVISLIQGLKEAGFQIHKALTKSYQDYLVEQKKNQPPRRQFRLPPPIPERPVSREEIQQACDQTRVAIITLGRNSGEFTDRKLEDDFYLSETERNLIQDVADIYHAAGKKVILVLNIGGVIETVSWHGQADAILLAWQPGQEAGYAITDILSGKINPSGKLATTFPVDYQDVPSSSNFPGKVLVGPDPNSPFPTRGAREAEVIYEDDIWVGYRHFCTRNVEPAYPFGFGLSYTEFETSPVEVSSGIFAESLTATVAVKNIGDRPGKTVVQCYIHAPGKFLMKPVRELRAFKKTKLLAPGESETLKFIIKSRDLASFETKKSAWIAEAGDYKLEIGSSSINIETQASFQVPEEILVEKVNRALVPEKRE